MLCSVLIPTRGRVAGLTRAIQSLHQSANPDNFDVRLRIDDDDAVTLKAVPRLIKHFGNVFPIVGPRSNGYHSVGEFIAQLASQSDARWLTMLDDDVTMEGSGWDEQLAALPPSGTVAVPEFYQLGPSKYNSGSCVGGHYLVGWFVPNRSWHPNSVCFPVDVWMHEIFVQRLRWTVALLKGVTYNHQRNEAAIREQRAERITPAQA